MLTSVVEGRQFDLAAEAAMVLDAFWDAGTCTDCAIVGHRDRSQFFRFSFLSAHCGFGHLGHF